MPSKSKTPRQVLASRHGHHRSPKLDIHQTYSFWHRRWRKYNAVPPLASSRQWNVGTGNVSMTSEKVLAKWPAEMSHSRYGECDFDPERAN